jgi:ribonuclease P protein component
VVLPSAVRMRRSDDFAVAVRRGRRAGRGTLVVHYLPPAQLPPAQPGREVAGGPLVGFVVGRALGGSVRRHRVVRQLRHLVRDRLDRLPAGSRTVVRALPAASGRHSADLGTDLDSALDRVLDRAAP